MLCLGYNMELRIEFFVRTLVRVLNNSNNNNNNKPEMNVAIVIMMCLGSNSAIGSDSIHHWIKTHSQLQLYTPGDKCHSQSSTCKFYKRKYQDCWEI